MEFKPKFSLRDIPTKEVGSDYNPKKHIKHLRLQEEERKRTRQAYVPSDLMLGLLKRI